MITLRPNLWVGCMLRPWLSWTGLGLVDSWQIQTRRTKKDCNKKNLFGPVLFQIPRSWVQTQASNDCSRMWSCSGWSLSEHQADLGEPTQHCAWSLGTANHLHLPLPSIKSPVRVPGAAKADLTHTFWVYKRKKRHSCRRGQTNCSNRNFYHVAKCYPNLRKGALVVAKQHSSRSAEGHTLTHGRDHQDNLHGLPRSLALKKHLKNNLAPMIAGEKYIDSADFTVLNGYNTYCTPTFWFDLPNLDIFG